jgi:hypothetical protein
METQEPSGESAVIVSSASVWSLSVMYRERDVWSAREGSQRMEVVMHKVAAEHE